MMNEMVGNESISILPFEGELPSNFADRLGIYYASSVPLEHKKQYGQFFTPIEIAHFMASFVSPTRKDKIRVLDPGCGIGILTAALCEAIVNKVPIAVKEIELVAFETDINILPFSEKSLNYLGEWLQGNNIRLTYFLCKNDFILHNSAVLNDDEIIQEAYDVIVCNPPYFKLAKEDERAIAAKNVIYGQTNIYSIFMLIATRLLSNKGKLIFITPRSFCSGSYFRLFREHFFAKSNIENVHIFNSRKDAFKRDKVLQENIIVVARKKPKRQSKNADYKLSISSSNGISDISKGYLKKTYISNLVNLKSYQKILHLPSSDIDENVIDIFKTWTGSLKLFDLNISTGPVVDFRSKDIIKYGKSKRTVPLFWLHNVESMRFVWPSLISKGKPKGQYIVCDDISLSRLVHNKNYVLLRRFSTKDDLRRLVATPYFCDNVPDASMIGIENHLNYIYSQSGELTIDETIGLAAILNSTLFDLYFRTFNGNINVSATELRDFPLPNFPLIRDLGHLIYEKEKYQSLYKIDELVNDVFNLSIDLSKVYG